MTLRLMLCAFILLALGGCDRIGFKLLHCICRLVAPNRPVNDTDECPILGADRKTFARNEFFSV